MHRKVRKSDSTFFTPFLIAKILSTSILKTLAILIVYIINLKLYGTLVASKIVEDNKDVVIMTNAGITIKLPVEQISILGRVTQGLRLISLRENQTVATVSIVDKVEEINDIQNEDNQ